MISALTPGKGRLKLTENGQLIADSPIEYKQGKNRYDLPMELKTPAISNTRRRSNPKRAKTTSSRTTGPMGICTSRGRGRSCWSPTPRALMRSGRPSATRSSGPSGKSRSRQPSTSRAMLSRCCRTDCIILCNVERFSLDESQMQAMHDAVFNEGTGLMMVGGNRSFGPAVTTRP